MIQRFRAFVRGDVQGVAFRWFVSREASGLGIRGWVRNRLDGRVEVLAEGDRDSLTALIEGLGRGPRLARVDDVDVCWEEATGNESDFRIERTV
jgi:acylphosphatase